MKKNNKNTQIKGQKIGQILGINVTSTTIQSLLMRVERNISDSYKFYIVTPNPELVLMAQKNENLKKALNDATMSIPDGIGLKLAIPDLHIIKGREFFLELIKLADEKVWKVFLLGGLNDEAKFAAQKLKSRFRNLKIESYEGPRLNQNTEPATEIDRKIQFDTIDRINNFKPQLLFVAFGNPKQEIWIHENLSKLNIGGAMAVGGTFRYIAGQSILPPKWMAHLGLEWLWRLFTEPFRVGRIFRAVVIFPLKSFWYKLSH